jgi:hypothetical protein
MGVRRRDLTVGELEARGQITRIRAAARKGKTAAEIADLHQLPLRMVERVLSPVNDVRLCDPAHLLNARTMAPGFAAAEVQVYWVGFLTAAGYIYGQGASLSLIVTLGERSQAHVETLMADLTNPGVHCEFCRSSIVGWQLYLRDPNLCKALIAWGIPSDLQGDDPALLEDIPQELAAPFLRGYLDGEWPVSGVSRDGKRSGFTFRGTGGVLAGINSMVRRCWGIDGGIVTPRSSGADLRFLDPQCEREIMDHIRTFTSRVRSA